MIKATVTVDSQSKRFWLTIVWGSLMKIKRIGLSKYFRDTLFSEEHPPPVAYLHAPTSRNSHQTTVEGADDYRSTKTYPSHYTEKTWKSELQTTVRTNPGLYAWFRVPMLQWVMLHTTRFTVSDGYTYAFNTHNYCRGGYNVTSNVVFVFKFIRTGWRPRSFIIIIIIGIGTLEASTRT